MSKKSKKFRVLKWIGLTLITLILLIVGFGVWFMSLIPSSDKTIKNTTVNDLTYLTENRILKDRGKILTVVTSIDSMGISGKSTGYELTELSRAYYVFEANGFEVDVASPKGGKAPVVIDDLGPFDYAFLKDEKAKSKINNTLKLTDIKADDYEAIYFVGGKGAMFDFPNNKSIHKIVKNLYENNKVVGAICHGPAALVNVTLNNGFPLIKGKTISSFTNKEELLLIADAKTIFPFLLQDKITAQGANFNEGEMYLNKVSVDKNIVTGQNPWSTWSIAENMIQQIGYKPKTRKITDEENAINVLLQYHKYGKSKAKEMITTMYNNNKPMNRVLFAEHSIVSVMKGEIGDFYNLLGLISFAKKVQENN